MVVRSVVSAVVSPEQRLDRIVWGVEGWTLLKKVKMVAKATQSKPYLNTYEKEMGLQFCRCL